MVQNESVKRRWCIIRDPRIFFLVMVLYSLAGGFLYVYMSSMTTTLEKRFDMSSKRMGILMGGNDIGYLTCVIIISYVSTKINKSILLFFSGLGQVISCVIFALPYFIFGPKFTAEDTFKIGQFIKASDDESLCHNTSYLIDEVQKNINISLLIPPGRDLDYENNVSFALQLMAGIISGIASTPFWNIGLALIDDMAGSKSGIYLAALFMTRSISPILGYMFGGWVIKQHESMTASVDQYPPGQKDPKWIGAWWFGYMIIAGITLLVIPFLAMIDSEGKHKETVQNSDESFQMTEKKDDDNIKKHKKKETDTAEPLPDLSQFSIKELLNIIKQLMLNPVYSTILVGMIFEISGFMGPLSFYTKYLEFHFRLEPAKASMLTGFSMAASSLFATFISGLVSHLCPMSTRRKNLYHLIVNSIAMILSFFLILLSCDTTNIIGFNKDEGGIAGECTAECACPMESYSPVCSNDKTYFSPCLAGCTQSINQTYSNCMCASNSTAVRGECAGVCTMLYPFVALVFVIKVIGGIASVQYMHIIMRQTEKKHKPIALAIVGFIFGVIGLVMPPIGGVLIDTACLFKSSASQGGKNFCLLYDTKKLHYLINGFAFAAQVPACFFYTISWWKTPKDPPSEDESSEIPSQINTE